MEESKIYRKLPLSDVHGREIKKLSSEDNTAIENILTRFRTFFIDKHS